MWRRRIIYLFKYFLPAVTGLEEGGGDRHTVVRIGLAGSVISWPPGSEIFTDPEHAWGSITTVLRRVLLYFLHHRLFYYKSVIFTYFIVGWPAWWPAAQACADWNSPLASLLSTFSSQARGWNVTLVLNSASVRFSIALFIFLSFYLFVLFSELRIIITSKMFYKISHRDRHYKFAFRS